MTRLGRLERIALATLAGILASISATQSPLLTDTAPLALPGIPLDLRVLILPLLFAATQTAAPKLGWPGQGLATLGLALLAALFNHAHASATLTFGNVPWAIPGTRVDLLPFGATLASVLIGLVITLHAGHERFKQRAQDRGLTSEELEPATRLAKRITRISLILATIAVTGLALAMRIVDRVAAGAELPLAELLALGILLAFGALLLGLDRREDFTLNR